MAQVIGKIEQLNGKFYVQDENGNIRELQVGDEVKENEIILGDDGNQDTSKVVILLNGSSDTIEILSNSQLKLDNTILNQIPQNEELTTTRESLNDALENLGSEDNKEDEDESLGLEFVDRTGDETDINSDLRVNSLENGAIQANFHGLQKSGNEDFGNFVSRSGNETDINSDLRESDNGNDDEKEKNDENLVDNLLPDIYSIINLTGDIVVNEGETATYNLSVDEAPLTDLLVTIKISHISTDNTDLPEKTITVTIPSGATEKSFTIDNFNDVPYDNAEEYKVSLVSVSEGGYTELKIGEDKVITEILDDLSLPVLSINDQTVFESEGIMTFTVTLDKVVEDDVTFDYVSSDNSAIAGSDYSSVNVKGFTIPAGLTSFTFTVPISDDYISDNNETFKITLSNPSDNVVIGDGIGIGTILDNSNEGVEKEPGGFDLSDDTVYVQLINDDIVGEGDSLVHGIKLVDIDGNNVMLHEGQTVTVSLNYEGTSANPTEGSDDFIAQTTVIIEGTLDGNNTAIITNPTLDDFFAESVEEYTISINTISDDNNTFEIIKDLGDTVTGKIDDDLNDKIPNQDEDSVFLQLNTDASVGEANGAKLTHQFHLVDKDNNPINLSSGESITVSLSYSSDGTAIEDFSDKKTTVTITGNGGSTYSFDNTIVDDFLNEGTESYNVKISSINSFSASFENIKVSSSVNNAIGTIIDGTNDAIPNETDNDTVYAVLTGDTTVPEGSTASYTVELLDIDGNPVVVSSDTDIKVTFTNGTTQDIDTEYLNNQILTVTIPNGSSSVNLSTDTIDDYLSDNGENYTLTITDIPVHEFEAIDYDGFVDTTTTTHLNTQTTTILDNSNPNTPNNPSDDTVEADVDTIEIRLFAIDAIDGSRKPANEVAEGSSAEYIAVAFDKNGTEISINETVEVTFSGNSATDNVDYTSTTQTVTLGVNFSTPTIDDYLSDNGETYNIQITDDSMSNDTDYETVDIDTTPVVTTINDNPSETPDNGLTPSVEVGGYDPVDDTVYVQLINNSAVGEGADLVHGIKLVDSTGADVMLEAGQNVTVTLTYTGSSVNPTEGVSDFTAQTTVTIVGALGGNNTATITNPTVDDYFAEGLEEYTISVNTISDDNSTFETIVDKGDTVIGTINDGANDQIPNQDVDTVYVQLSGDEVVNEGSGIVITHDINLVDKDNNAVNLANGETITLTIVYSNTSGIDAVEAADFQTPLTTNVLITGNGGSSYTFTNTVDADNLDEGNEGYTANINTVNTTYFENIEVDPANNEATALIQENLSLVDDAEEVVEGSNVVDETTYANLLSNDIELGENGKITSFTYFDETATQQTATLVAGTATVDTQYGNLTIEENGDWSYTSDPKEDHTSGDLLDNIVLTITDDNGKIGTTNFVITVKDTVPVAINDDEVTPRTVEENSSAISGNVINDGQGDDTLGADDTIVSDFTYVNDSSVSTTYTFGTSDDGTDVNGAYKTVTADDGTLKVWENGDWEFTPNTSVDNSSGVVPANFDYTIKDSDGDTSSATQYINITDTTPTAFDDTSRSVIEGDPAINGNVITNDTLGADGSVLNAFTYTKTDNSSETLTFSSSNTSYTRTTPTGELTVNQDGTWIFTPTASFDHDDDNTAGSFTYTLIDGDGDISNVATQPIVITDSSSIPTIDNLNNTPVIVYEGDSKVTFDGILNYDKSDTNAAKDTTSTLTHKLDFTQGSDKAGVTSITFDGTTQIISEDGSTTITDDDKGVLTVNYDGTWEYTPPATYTHPDANDVNSLLTSFTYTVSDIDGDSVSTGVQSIQVDDTLPTLDSTTDVMIDEKYLPSGTAPSNTPLTQTGDIDITLTNSASNDLIFSSTQTDSTLLNAALSSLGEDVNYEISADGHTMTLYTGMDSSTNHVLVVTIVNPTSANPTYSAVLSEAFDHETALLENGNIEFDFNITLVDDDNDIKEDTFKVSIIDDVSPDSQVMVVDEDSTTASENTITTNADVTNTNTVIDGTNGSIAPVYGTAIITNDGKLHYEPTGNYSGEDTLTYATTLDDGTIKLVTVTITVNPIADAPGITKNNVSTIEDNTNTTDDTTGSTTTTEHTIGMQLNLPTLSLDNQDQNDGNVTDSTGTTAGDHSERLGYIELKFTNGTAVSGAVVSDGTKDFTISNNDDTLLIYITNLTNGDDATDYHHSGLNPATDSGTIWQLTQAEYEALTITHTEDNDTDVDFDISITSYEVNSSRTPISPEESETTTLAATIKIHPATDDITLAWDDTARGSISTTTNADDTYTFTGINEGDGTRVIDLQALLTKTSGYESDANGDLDGTEDRSYTISGIPNGTIINLGGTTATASGGTTNTSADASATVIFSNANNQIDDPTFTMTLPEQYGGNITNGVITLSVKDSGVEGDDIASSTKTASVYFNIDVTEQPDTPTIQVSQAIGDEDAGRSDGNISNTTGGASGDADYIDVPQNGINLDITVTSDDEDGSESFNVTISKIPDGGSIYYNGNEYTVADASATGETDSNGNGSAWSLTIDDFNNSADLKFIPPHNSDLDYVFDISAETDDGRDVSGSATDAITMNVDVIGVADIPQDDTLKTMDETATDNGNSSTDIYSAVVLEDSGDKDSRVTDGSGTGAQIAFTELYSASNFASYDSDGSEAMSIVITGLSDSFDVVGATAIGGTGEARQWVFDSSTASNVIITTDKHYSGEETFAVKYVTTEREGDSKTHDVVPVTILVTPLAEATMNTLTTVNEDVFTKVDFSAIQGAGETNETIETVKILKSDVAGKDFTLFYGDIETTISEAVGNGNVTDNGTYFVLDSTALNNIYVQHNADLSTSTDSFNILYTVKDSANTTNGSTSVEDLDVDKAATYNLTLNAITDDITVTNTVTDTADIDVLGSDITVNTQTSIQVNLAVSGVDTANEYVLDSNISTNTIDDDGSESITRLMIEDVPVGVRVEGALYGGATNGGETGVWYLDIADVVQNEATENISFNLIVDGDDSTYTTANQTITINVYNQDGIASEQTGSTTINLIKGSGFTNTPPTAGVNMDIDDANGFVVDNAFEVVEDTTTLTLADLTNVNVNSTTNGGNAVTSTNFSITIENVANATVSGTGVVEYNGVYILTGSGDQAEIEARLADIKIIPDQDYNENNADTMLSLTATLTTYAPGGVEESMTVNIAKDVTPVTDTVTTNATITYVDENGASTATAKEDGTYSISLDFETVDDLDASGNFASDGPNGNNTDFEFVQGSANDSTVTNITISWSSGIKGTISWDGGTHDYTTDGNDAIIPFDKLNTLTFTPEANKSGNVTLSYNIYTKEEGASNIETTTNTLSFDVEAIADGLTLPDLGASGDEDTLIELFSDLLNSIKMDVADDSLVSGESIQTLMIDGVPDGFLIKVGAAGATLAQNVGDNGSGQTFDLYGDGSQNVGFNLWNIDISGGVPQIWLQSPENLASNTPLNLVLVTTVDDSGEIVTSREPFDVMVVPVADSIAINPTKTFGQALSDIDIKINATVIDLDGSETITMTLEGLGENATFKANGYEIASTYTAANGGTYVIEGIASSDINNMTFAVPTTRSGSISVDVKMVDVNGDESTVDSGSFNLTVSGSGTTVDPLDPITNSLTGNQTLDVAAVDAATDDNNSLIVYDASAVTFTDSGDWSAGVAGTYSEAGFTIYTHTSGSRVLVENQASSGDDTLSFKDGNAINGLGGLDTIVLAGESIDYSKLSNIENIDLSAEQNTLADLTYSDVINMTDSNNELKIFGDTSDIVELESGDGWTKESDQVVEDGHSFDVYTNSNDSSVTVKVEDNVQDQII